MTGGPVLVRLTDAQRGALRTLASMTYENGDGSPALGAAVAALDACVPALTRAQWEALVGATTDAASLADDYDGGQLLAWRSRDAASSRALRALHKLHGWRRGGSD